MKIVRCNKCGCFIGDELSLDFVFTNSKDEYEQFIDYECCPECGSITGLFDCDWKCSFSDAELKALWCLFGDVPIDDADNTKEEFLGFPAGTYRFDIWKWFDEKYSGGVHALIDEVNDDT